MRGGKAENRPGLPAEAVSKKGRTTPLYFEGLKFARLGFRQSIYDPAGNFYTSDNGEKRVVNAKKRSSQPEKSGENSAYAHKKSLFCYFLEKASMENHFGFCALKNRNPA